jgi:hypothetical protein
MELKVDHTLSKPNLTPHMHSQFKICVIKNTLRKVLNSL